MRLPEPRLPEPPLLVITDRHQAARPIEEIAEAAFAAGCRWLSLREKDMAADKRLGLLRRLIAIGRRWDAIVGVHDDLAAARLTGAALHLPAGSSVAAVRRALPPDTLIGLSTHSGDALAASEADYVTLSPIHATRSKPGYGPALGLSGLAAAARRSAMPLIALGGIEAADVSPCLSAGATGVAVMGNVMGSSDPAAVVAALLLGFADPPGVLADRRRPTTRRP